MLFPQRVHGPSILTCLRGTNQLCSPGAGSLAASLLLRLCGAAVGDVSALVPSSALSLQHTARLASEVVVVNTETHMQEACALLCKLQTNAGG